MTRPAPQRQHNREGEPPASSRWQVQLRPWCSAWLGWLVSAASQAAGPSATTSETLIFDVAFSLLSFVAANNIRLPHSPVALGDELTFHDQLFSKGKHAGDTLGSCVIVSIPPAAILANCTTVFGCGR